MIDLIVAGRAIQGVGGGGILSLTEILVTDLVSLAERGLYIGIIGSVWAFAASIGPVVGGALAESNWRWLFYRMFFPCTKVIPLTFCDQSIYLSERSLLV